MGCIVAFVVACMLLALIVSVISALFVYWRVTLSVIGIVVAVVWFVASSDAAAKPTHVKESWENLPDITKPLPKATKPLPRKVTHGRK